jgi:hypothetical protein
MCGSYHLCYLFYKVAIAGVVIPCTTNKKIIACKHVTSESEQNNGQCTQNIFVYFQTGYFTLKSFDTKKLFSLHSPGQVTQAPERERNCLP